MGKKALKASRRRRVKKDQTGNPALLQRAIDAQTRIDKICGNEAPVENDVMVGISVVSERRQRSLLDVANGIPGIDLSQIARIGGG